MINELSMDNKVPKTPNLPYSKISNAITGFTELSAGAGNDGMKLDARALKFGDKWYLSKRDGTPILNIDQDSNMKFNVDATIEWGSGRKITADAASMTADGNWLVLGGVRATSYTVRIGETDYQGVNQTFTNGDGKLVTVRAGLITDIAT